jgi:basic amino acid/polyamine antiporter, APA family
MLKRKTLTLRRDLGLFEATMCGMGIIFGAGIYVLMGAATGIAGNAVWLSFLIASIIAVFTGLSYAELSSLFPKDSGEYIYAEKAFGKKIAFIVGYFIILAGVVSASAVALGFAGYFDALFGIEYLVPVAIALLAVFSFVNFYGIKHAVKASIIFTCIETSGLLLIIALGFKYIGSVNYFEMPHGLTGVFSASALVFFAFLGFDSIIKLSEETKNPTKIIPKALLLAISITTTVYVLVAISAVSILGWDKIAASTAPLADVAAAALGSNAFILLAAIALFSTANTVLIILIATSRMIYGMSKDDDRSLPETFSQVHKKRRTPWIAVISVLLLSSAFAMIGDITIVAELTNFAVFSAFMVVNASLIALRYKSPNLKRKFKVPLNIGKFPVLPLLGIITCIFMLANLELIVIAGGITLIAVGLLMHYGLKELKYIKA